MNGFIKRINAALFASSYKPHVTHTYARPVYIKLCNVIYCSPASFIAHNLRVVYIVVENYTVCKTCRRGMFALLIQRENYGEIEWVYKN